VRATGLLKIGAIALGVVGQRSSRTRPSSISRPSPGSRARGALRARGRPAGPGPLRSRTRPRRSERRGRPGAALDALREGRRRTRSRRSRSFPPARSGASTTWTTTPGSDFARSSACDPRSWIRWRRPSRGPTPTGDFPITERRPSRCGGSPVLETSWISPRAMRDRPGGRRHDPGHAPAEFPVPTFRNRCGVKRSRSTSAWASLGKSEPGRSTPIYSKGPTSI